MKSKATSPVPDSIQSSIYNRIEDQVLKALYNGSTAATDLKKFTLSSLTRFFEQKCEKMHDTQKRELYYAITGKKSTSAVGAVKLAVAGTNYLSTETDLFTKRIKPSLEGLTVNEAIVLKMLCNQLASWRFDEPSYSCIEGSDVTRDLKFKSSTWNAKSTAGVLGSLSKKGYINVETSGDFKDLIYPCWHRIPKNFPNTVGVEDAINPKEIAKSKAAGFVEAKISAESVKSISDAVKKAIVKQKQDKVKSTTAVSAKKKVSAKPTPAEREIAVSEASFTGKKYKPFEKYGMHGTNVELAGFTKGVKVSFQSKGEQKVGDFIHFHINNHSPKGYAVINYDGKIIERAAGKFSLYSPEVVVPEVTIKEDKKVAKSTKKAPKTAIFDTVATDIEIDKVRAGGTSIGTTVIDAIVASVEAKEKKAKSKK